MAKGRTYTTIKSEYSNEGYLNFAKKVTMAYAQSEDTCTQSQVAEDNDLTVGCLRRLMDDAITEVKVSRVIAERIMEKSIGNQQKKHSEAGRTSINHHKELMTKRNENIAKKLEVEEVDQVVKDAIALGNQFEEVMTKYKKLETLRVLYLVFERAVASIIASDDETEKLLALIVRKYPGEQGRNFCNRLRKERRETMELLS